MSGNLKVWNENGPQMGSSEVSNWQPIPELVVPNPWQIRKDFAVYEDDEYCTPLNVGYVSVLGQPLVKDQIFSNYRSKFGWGDTADFQTDRIIENGEAIITFAQRLLSHVRSNTFSSFQEGVLGITIETRAALWKPEGEYIDSDNLDALPHLDWVQQDQPVIIGLGACSLPSLLWNGSYIYKGDLQDSKWGSRINYFDEIRSMRLMIPALGSIMIGDARRALHARPTLMLNDENTMRVYSRIFIAPVTIEVG